MSACGVIDGEIAGFARGGCFSDLAEVFRGARAECSEVHGCEWFDVQVALTKR